MALKSKATSKGGEGGDFEIPPAGMLTAVMVGMIDLGSQDVSYGDKQGEAQKVLLIWELTGEPMTATPERNHVICRDYRLSGHEKSTLRKMYESWIGRKFSDDEDIDWEERIGKPCSLTIIHAQTKTTNRTYAKVDSCGPLTKGVQVQPPKIVPFVWTIDEGLRVRDKATKQLVFSQTELPQWEWLPFLYGRKVHEVIADSPEWKDRGGEPVGAGVGDQGYGDDGSGGVAF